MNRHGFLAPILVLATAVVSAQTTYQQPPKPILDVLSAPETPLIYVSPSRTSALLAERLRYPPIAELAEPMLRLAGVRINPKTNGQHRATRYTGLSAVNLNNGATRRIALPDGVSVLGIRWSPDGRRFAFLLIRENRIEPWIGDASDASVRRLADVAVNAAVGTPLQWMPDSATLIVQTVPAGRGVAPQKPTVPAGPVIQESQGSSGPVRTYQDLLTDETDEALFEYYATSQLALVDAGSGKVKPIGKPVVCSGADPSPDGKLLMVESVRKPYSYLHPYYLFPSSVDVWDVTGKTVKELARRPLADNVPIGGVPTGPRNHHWHPLDPATAIWIEALDEGNPKKKVTHRDRVLLQSTPFGSEAREFAKTEQRYQGLNWSERGDFALIHDYDRDKRWVRTFRLDPADPSAEPVLVWSRAQMDQYADAGTLVTRNLSTGHRAIQQSGDLIFLAGSGASPQGDRPFLDQFQWEAAETERLFHCAEDAYETVVAVLDDAGRRLLTRHESPTEPPNYFIHDLKAGSRTAITEFKDPVPQIRAVTKRRVTYKRDDGVDLAFTLYLPPGYKEGEGEPLPTVMWAYPREFNSPRTAGQIRGSTKRFTLISGTSHLFYLLSGYAILDGASLPVIGEPEVANNTFVEQIVSGAKAAIDKAAELGVTDPDRVGVGGHSYGAFMTANLLAHSDLFRAGVARSGAYNRTLTPFGFQAERRTFWEAPEIYFKVSPFMNAHRINEPMLMIHGQADNNSGTFPVQSERMYHAIKGNGGVVRLVMLPHESHGYAGRESIEHVLAEMIGWFEEYVKPERSE